MSDTSNLVNTPEKTSEISNTNPEKKLSLERLKDISQLGIVFAVLLYVLGFLTVNAFLARFGIVSFDIINARYLIAGILCLLPLSLVLWMAWHIGSTKMTLPFSVKRMGDRIGIYGNLIFWTFAISQAFVLLFNAGAIAKQYSAAKLTYTGMGKYDVAAKYLNFLDHLGAMGYVLKMASNIAIVLILLILFFYVAGKVRFYFWPKAPAKENPKIKASVEKPKVEKQEQPATKPVWLLIGRCIEAVLIAVLLAMLSYCYTRIRSDIFDFNSFENTKLSDGTFFAWFFGSISSTYVLISLLQDGFSLDIRKLKKIRPDGASYLLQSVIVPIFGSIILFGQTIFPRIPYMIGGGQPRLINLQIRNQELLGLGSGSKLYLLGESSQFLYIAAISEEHGKALQINKNEVEFMTTKTGTGISLKQGSGSLTAVPNSSTGAEIGTSKTTDL